MPSRAPRSVPPVSPVSRRLVLQAGALALALPAAWPARAQMPLSSAINRVARFRALSQRCAKAYAQVHLAVLPDHARQVLAAAQRLIHLGFDDLGRAALAGAVQQNLAQVRTEWAALAKLLEAAPAAPVVLAVAGQADRMLAAADRTTQSLEAQAGQPSARLVNVAGRQRMLSQRLAKNYFLAAVGGETKPLRDQLAQDGAAFVDALALLSAAPLSTPQIRNELALGEQQWLFFADALKRKPDPASMRTVATTSERVLEVMDNLTALYDAALRELLGHA